MPPMTCVLQQFCRAMTDAVWNMSKNLGMQLPTSTLKQRSQHRIDHTRQVALSSAFTNVLCHQE